MHSIEDELVALDCQLADLVETHGKAGKEGDEALTEVPRFCKYNHSIW